MSIAKARWIASVAVIVRRDRDNVPLPLTAGNQTLLGATIRSGSRLTPPPSASVDPLHHAEA